MKIAIIDNFDSFVFNLVRYLDEENDIETIVMRNDAIDYRVIEEVDGILLSPGPGTPEEANQLIELIERFKEIKNILGVCLGHQALVVNEGGHLIQCISPQHGKSSHISIQPESQLFKYLPHYIPVGRYHSWMVDGDQLSNWKITAKTEENEIMAVEHKTLKLFGVQFHPESILTPNGRTIINNWINTLR